MVKVNDDEVRYGGLFWCKNVLARQVGLAKVGACHPTDTSTE